MSKPHDTDLHYSAHESVPLFPYLELKDTVAFLRGEGEAREYLFPLTDMKLADAVHAFDALDSVKLNPQVYMDYECFDAPVMTVNAQALDEAGFEVKLQSGPVDLARARRESEAVPYDDKMPALFDKMVKHQRREASLALIIPDSVAKRVHGRELADLKEAVREAMSLKATEDTVTPPSKRRSLFEKMKMRFQARTATLASRHDHFEATHDPAAALVEVATRSYRFEPAMVCSNAQQRRDVEEIMAATFQAYVPGARLPRRHMKGEMVVEVPHEHWKEMERVLTGTHISSTPKFTMEEFHAAAPLPAKPKKIEMIDKIDDLGLAMAPADGANEAIFDPVRQDERAREDERSWREELERARQAKIRRSIRNNPLDAHEDRQGKPRFNIGQPATPDGGRA